MSYENLSNDSRSILESSGFTQISNKVINNIKDGDAFLVWCYLYSKSENWKTIKQNIKNVYGFGDDKLKQIFSYLKRANLISYMRITCANGRFAHMEIKVLNGSKFDINQPFKQNKTAGVKTTPPDSYTCGFDELQNKDITKQRKERKTKSLSASDDAQSIVESSFNQFWQSYPVKKNKERSFKVWKRDGLSKKLDTILDDVNKRLANEWKNKEKKFIPHPSTYLNEKRWNDEILYEITEKQEPKNNFSSALKQFGLR
jgi:hypothetical protein